MLRSLALLGFLVAFALATSHDELPLEAQELTGQDLIEHINKQGKWQATSYSMFEGKSADELKQFLGYYDKPSRMPLRGVQAPKSSGNFAAPPSFDAVKAWPQCADIVGLIQDQSACGSCWAVSSASVMSDRLCIASNGKVQKSLSSLELLSCCSSCTLFSQCGGGWPDEAFNYFIRSGIVTGTNYTIDGGCKPYPIAPCQKSFKTGKITCPPEPTRNWRCARECIKGYTDETYVKDHYYGQGRVIHFRNDNDAVIEELVKNGPVVAAFTVYADFMTYKSGIYEHVAGRKLGGHAVRIVGYGEENGVKYWKVANSWHDYWGETGYFRIKRGTNDCGFEERIVTSAVDVQKSLKDK